MVVIWSSPGMRDDDGRKLDHKTLEQLRIRAVRQIEQGAHPEEIAAARWLPILGRWPTARRGSQDPWHCMIQPETSRSICQVLG